MAGCLLIHVGVRLTHTHHDGLVYVDPILTLQVDLTKEGLIDSRGGLDSLEYASVIVIALVMTFYGLTAGLVLGLKSLQCKPSLN
jgi:hypothetical protein